MKKRLFFLCLSAILFTTQATFAENPDYLSFNLPNKPNIIFEYRIIEPLEPLKPQTTYNNDKPANDTFKLEMAYLINKLRKDLE